MKYTCNQFPMDETFECDTEDELLFEIERLADDWDEQENTITVIDENGAEHRFELLISVSARRIESKAKENK